MIVGCDYPTDWLVESVELSVRLRASVSGSKLIRENKLIYANYPKGLCNSADCYKPHCIYYWLIN